MPYVEEASANRKKWQWMIGILCIVVVALIWSFASILVQYIFHEKGFNRPFFLTYVANSLFAVNLLLWGMGRGLNITSAIPRRYHEETICFSPKGNTSEIHIQRNMGNLGERLFECLRAWINQPPYVPVSHSTITIPADLSIDCGPAEDKALLGRPSVYDRPYSHLQTAKAGLIVCPLWFIANCTYNFSLGMTSVTSNTVISTTSSLFTLLFSVAILKEDFTVLKLCGVLLCMLGNILTTIHDDATSSNESALGDIICLFSAFMYGTYTTTIRALIPNDQRVSLALFFGYLGIFNAILFLPFVYVLHVTGYQSLSNLTWEILGLLVLKGLFDNVLSDYLWAKAVVLTSPTVATLGLSLTIPIAVLSDLILHGISPTFVSVGAALLVIGGFAVINVSSR